MKKALALISMLVVAASLAGCSHKEKIAPCGSLSSHGDSGFVTVLAAIGLFDPCGDARSVNE